MDERLMIQALMCLIGLVVALIGFIWNGHNKQHDKVNKVLEELMHTKQTCMGIFALKQDLAEVSGRVAVLEKIKTGE